MPKENFHVMNIDHGKTRKAPAAGQQILSMEMLFGRNFLKEKHIRETFSNRSFRKESIFMYSYLRVRNNNKMTMHILVNILCSHNS